MAQMHDVVIIGGGLAGYTAANHLSGYNLSILLLEKAKNIGGRARTNKVQNQYLNIGPHAFHKKGKAKSILERFGVELHGNSPKLNGILLENHIEYAAPFTPSGTLATSLLNWKERIEWIIVIAKVNQLDTENLTGQTFEQWVKQVAPSQKVQSLLYILGRLATYCHAPEKVSAKLIVSHIKSVMGGVLYLDGGWQTIIDQLHHRAVISHVKVQTHVTVKQITSVKHDIKLILSNGDEVLTKYVICTTSPAELNKMLSEQADLLPPVFNEFTSVRGAALDVALTHLPNPKRLFAMDMIEPIYYSVHSNYARLSKDGKSAVLHVFKYYHPEDQIDGKKVQSELECFLEKMQPGWKEFKITSRYMPHVTVNQRLPQIGAGHMQLRSQTDITGLYIAGDWASPHSILAEGAIESGLHAAEEILQKEKR